MSKGIKILWAIIGCLFGLGIILCAVGIAMGGSPNAYVDRSGLHFGGESQTYELSDYNTEEFDSIDVDLLASNVSIVESDSYGYEFAYTGTSDPKVEVHNGTLSAQENHNWALNLFGFWRDDFGSTLTVYVPAQTDLKKVNISVASGDTSLEATDLTIDEAKVESASGFLRLEGLKINNLTVDTASGDVRLLNIEADKIKVSMASGKLSAQGVFAQTFKVDIASGDVDFEGEVVDTLDLDMVSGDADFTLPGSEDDYSFDMDKLSGHVRVNGYDISDLGHFGASQNARTRAHVDIDLTSGSVNFTIK